MFMGSFGFGMQMMPGMGMPMMGMGGMGMGGMQQLFIMLQLMQMMQMMQMLMGNQGGCSCGGFPGMGFGPGMGNMMGLPGAFPSTGIPGAWGGPTQGTFPPLTGAHPPVDMGQIRGGTAWGRTLAADAGRNANGPGGWCYRWVAQALRRHGVNVHGGSAYMAADQLAQKREFREVHGLRNDQLRQLPPGAVVVWDRGPGKPHGHISIALGDGREASDKLRNQITNYGTRFRVFLPNK